ncbi:MAG TPA: ferredoxin reductase [Solirubrobacteraceae bacterium]|nr:ferredoxin reductase [Solirubrobacteraceae bacterium]
MAETGATPKVPKLQRVALRAVRAFSTPLLPDDYLELINPLWSTRELRGRIERIDHVTGEAATVTIKPGYRWQSHRAGQYLRIGVDIRGVRHWRAYSLTSEPNRPDGCISITPKLVQGGVVSPYLVRHGRPGAIVSLGGVEGDFVLPDPPPGKLLFISAGSGITPIISMLRSLCRQDALTDAVLLHSARTPEEVIFGGELRYLDRCFPGFKLHEQHTSKMGRLAAEHLDELCPDWRERQTFASGPGPMLDTLTEHWERDGDPRTLHMERFQPKLGIAETGEGGTITFLKSATQVESDGTKPILVCGEEAGLELPFGCREGICHTCVGTLRSGRIRDLRNGDVSGQDGQSIRTCINAPEGPVEIEL